MGSKSNIDYTFKHCRKGHYYQGDECPYCKAQKQSLEDVTGHDEDSMHNMKTCMNGHAYYKSALRCPYCGEEKVCGTADMVTAWICELSLEFGSEIAVQIDNYPITKASKLKISYAQHTHRTGYWIVDLPVFDYRSTIQIGNVSFTGKEFVKWIDTIASMGIKKMDLFW